MQNIGLKETLTIEFKSDRSKLPDGEIVDAVVAFANTSGGTLYLGVEDDGNITGLHKDHTDSTQLSAFIANRTVPPVSVRCETEERGAPFLKISVPRCTGIVASSSGKVLRRRLKADGSPENVPLYPYEITNRLSDLSLLDFSAQPVPDAVYADLDAVERARLRNIIRVYYGENKLLDLNDDELDKALRLAVTVEGRLVPTYAGLLLIGRQDRLRDLMPTAESSVQVLSGTDIIVNESFTLPLLAAFEKISDHIGAWNREQEMEIGLFRVSIPDIDKRAFREALVNAFCHRDYSMLGRVRVQLNDEGLSVSNPGGFIEGVSLNNLLNAEPHGRNPVLADALKRIGLAERTGRGIDRIFEGSLLYGRLLPDYSASTERQVSLFIPKSLPDPAFISMLSNEQKKLGRPLSLHHMLILSALKYLHRASAQSIARQTGIDETRTRAALEILMESGLAEASGSGAGRDYLLSSKAYARSDDVIAYVRQTDIDKLRYQELILKLAAKKGYITRKDAAELLRISPPQAYRVLQKLSKSGKIKLSGAGKSAKYILP